jgi:hypothetical protein
MAARLPYRNIEVMTVMGQSRRFGHRPGTSGLHRTTDIVRPARLVRFVPTGDIVLLSDVLASFGLCLRDLPCHREREIEGSQHPS